MPRGLAPMMARVGRLPAPQPEYGFEVKWDGVRALVYSEPGRMRIESRNGRDITHRYPELRGLNRQLADHAAILDGEIVAFGPEGKPSFELLQRRMHVDSEPAIRARARSVPVTYIAFDLLFLDGRSMLQRPYRERRAALEGLGIDGPAWQTPAYRRDDGGPLLEASAAAGLEGIVAKRLDSPYEPGRRSGAWIKVKNTFRQDLVIGGWLPQRGRARLGALLVGYRERGDAAPRDPLRFAGKVGTGFDEREARSLTAELERLRRQDSPFEGRQPQRGARFAEPRLVAEIEFAGWTESGMLRAPSYKGLRPDKPPEQVVREDPLQPG